MVTFNPCHVSYQGVFRYHWGDKVGYGEAADIFGLDYLAEDVPSRPAPGRLA